MADEKLLEKLAQDKGFIGKIVAMPTVGDVQKAFKDKGADLSLAEVENFGKVLSAAAENKGKLSDDVLTASGGAKLKTWHKLAIAGGALAAIAGASYAGYKHKDEIKGTVKRWTDKFRSKLASDDTEQEVITDYSGH